MNETTTRRKLGLMLALPLTMVLGVGVAFAQTPGTEVDRPSSFTSAFSVTASPDQVPPEDGERGNPDASGTYDLELNSDEEIICFDITVTGANAPFESPAATANHIHRGFAGIGGPAVVLFPNPEAGSDGTLTVDGCLQEPFNPDEEISLADIEAAPANYYVDIHTADFPRGDVRGQLTGTRVDAAEGDPAATEDAMPAEGQGVAAGFGGATEQDRAVPLTLAAMLLALAGATTLSTIAGRRAQAR